MACGALAGESDDLVGGELALGEGLEDLVSDSPRRPDDRNLVAHGQNPHIHMVKGGAA